MFSVRIQHEPIILDADPVAGGPPDIAKSIGLDGIHGTGGSHGPSRSHGAPSSAHAIGRDDCGAEVRFLGKVRNDPAAAPLTSLVLEHFPGVTESEITRIVDLARSRWALQKVRVVHRVGRISVGETIVLVETASAHRRDAYEANVFIMDYLKTQAPFWKQECFADGHEHWVAAKDSDQEAARRWGAVSIAEQAPAAVPAPRIGALVLAGGEGRRMGYCNKGLQSLHGRPMVAHVLECVRPYVEFLSISANRDLDAYQALGVPVYPDDTRFSVRGPLAGLAAALPHFPATLDAVLVVPCDCPLLPADLVPQLFQALQNSSRSAVVAHTRHDGRLRHHAVFMCRPAAFLGLIPRLHADADHSLLGWLREQGYDALEFPDDAAFVNVNDVDTLDRLCHDIGQA